jgi:YD repeat-containing protein
LIYLLLNKISHCLSLIDYVIANGVRTGMNYDAASRLEELATELTGSTPSQIRTLNFEYNPAGQITRRSDTGGSFAFAGHTDQTSIYDHNALNQIIDITETGVQTQTITPTWTDGHLTALVRPGDNGQPETTLLWL